MLRTTVLNATSRAIFEPAKRTTMPERPFRALAGPWQARAATSPALAGAGPSGHFKHSGNARAAPSSHFERTGGTESALAETKQARTSNILHRQLAPSLSVPLFFREPPLGLRRLRCFRHSQAKVCSPAICTAERRRNIGREKAIGDEQHVR